MGMKIFGMVELTIYSELASSRETSLPLHTLKVEDPFCNMKEDISKK
jgi:hypothetical protein